MIIADGGYLPRFTDRAGNQSTGAGVWACPDCTDPRGTGVVEPAFNGYGGAEGTIMKKFSSSRMHLDPQRVSPRRHGQR